MLLAIRYQCLSLENPKYHVASRTQSFYLANTEIKESWMDGALFEDWVRELDRKFAFEGESIALVIDTCPAHPHIENLKSMKLFFFTTEYNISNTTYGSRRYQITES